MEGDIQWRRRNLQSATTVMTWGTRSTTERQQYLEVALGVKKQVFRFNVSMSDTLAMKVLDAIENLFEAAFNLARAHPPADTNIVNVSFPRASRKESSRKFPR
jgi:hypothetical protein